MRTPAGKITSVLESVPGIGKVFARKIVKALGGDTLRVLSEDHAKLCTVRGLGKVRAAAIMESWRKTPAKRGSRENEPKRVNIVDVVSRVVSLKPVGSGRFRGRCPFCNKTTPFFHVDSGKGFYKCLGCGKAGDVISFVRETERLDFAEAVETLGKRFDVSIEYE